jgi:PAS domain S-box-containing protein
MSWITIIWSMVMSTCLMLAAIHLLAWFRKQTEWTNLLFSLMAMATAALAFCELWMMRSETPGEFGLALRWLHVPAWVIILTLVGFVRLYMEAGRLWLAWAVFSVRTVSLILNFVFTPNLNYREITALGHVTFLGESVSVGEGVSNPWMLVGQLSFLLFVLFVTDAAITVWRRGDRRQALVMGGSIVFFVVAGTAQAVLVLWETIHWPLTTSLFFMAIAAAMVYEMSRDVQQSAKLSDDLRKSEAWLRDITFSMADWVWEVDEKGVYTFSSAKGSELFGPVIGKTPFDLMPPEEAKRVQTLFAEIASRKAPIKDLENWNVGKNGEMICLLTNGVPILDEAGDLKGYRGVDKDITGRKQTEEAIKENDAALRNSKKDLQRLAGRLISAQEEELRRLSRELHDDLTQRLAVLAIAAGKLELDLNKMPEKCPDTIHTVAQMKDQLIKISEDVHTISRQLHPTILDDLGLVRAIESECSSVMRRYPMWITFRNEDVTDEIPDDVALCLYRVVQEGLRNIAIHSGSKNCEIFLKGDDHTLCLSVSDDGIGFDPLEVRKLPGLGLSSMRERVQLIGGDFAIRSHPGEGTEINVCVPLTGGVS